MPKLNMSLILNLSIWTDAVIQVTWDVAADMRHYQS